MTGGARTAFLVKPPAVAQLVALTRSATSGVPSAFRPAGAAAALKPRGEGNEPVALSASPEDIGPREPRPPPACRPPTGRRITPQYPPSRASREACLRTRPR